jgi:hypothetical protein
MQPLLNVLATPSPSQFIYRLDYQQKPYRSQLNAMSTLLMNGIIDNLLYQDMTNTRCWVHDDFFAGKDTDVDDDLAPA